MVARINRGLLILSKQYLAYQESGQPSLKEKQPGDCI